MTISVNIVVLNQPYGNPGSVGEPLGLWFGDSDVTGDASGGFVEVSFVPQNPATTPTLDDQRRQYVWFVDGVMINVSTTDPGNFSSSINMHAARANAAVGSRFRHQLVVDSLPTAGIFKPGGSLVDDHMTRTPIFWDSQELSSGNSVIVRLIAEINTDTRPYQFRAYGRYYDRQILSNRGFGRLVSPAAVSQFEG